MAAGTANEAFSRGWQYREADLRASGFQPPAGVSGPAMLRVNWKFNGGIASRIVSRLEAGDRVFRFTDSKVTTREERASGFWWFDLEAYRTLRKLASGRDARFREFARMNFAVLPEWGDLENLATGVIRNDYWVFKGMSASARSERDSISGVFTLDVLQIYVPGRLTVTDLSDVRDDILTRSFY